MRSAVSPPWLSATGRAVAATLALMVTSPRSHQVRGHGEPNHAARAELSQIERDLDALTDLVTSSIDAFHAAQTECEITRTRAELARLRTETELERRLLAARARSSPA